MYKTALSCTKTFLFMGSSGSTLQKCSFQSGKVAAASFAKAITPSPRLLPKQFSFTFPVPVIKQGCRRVQRSRLNLNFKDRAFRRKICAGSSLAFSLSLLGLFNKKEELSVEDQILMEMKKAILAIQVRQSIKVVSLFSLLCG